MKKYQIILSHAVLSLLVLVLGVWLGYRLSALRSLVYDAGDSEYAQAVHKFSRTFDIIRNDYVDSIDYNTLVDHSIEALLLSLDPHSFYLDPETSAFEDEQREGSLDGIGVRMSMVNDTSRIIHVIEEGPAAKSILRPGDKILVVDGDTVAGKGYKIEQVVAKVKGPRRSKVTLSILRPGETAPRDVSLQRASIFTPSVQYYDMLTDTIGYIYISSFTLTTGREFHNGLLQLKQRGMRHLILDMRDNGGGLLEAAKSVANELLPADRLIVYLQGDKWPRSEVHSTGGGLFTEGGITVLINEETVSASEIVAGAIQDNDRGMVVGQRSYGKGLVQHTYRLPDNSAVNITVARYYTPSGRCIQLPYKGGIYMMDYYLNRIFSSDSALYYAADTVPYYTREGRVVYGGGGIMPDYKLPVESDRDVIYFNKVRQAGLYGLVALEEVAINWEELKRDYPDADAFVKRYQVDAELFNKLLSAADGRGIKRNPAGIAKYGDDMRVLLKAEMAKCLYNDHAYYRILSSLDRELSHVLRFIEAGSVLPSA